MYKYSTTFAHLEYYIFTINSLFLSINISNILPKIQISISNRTSKPNTMPAHYQSLNPATGKVVKVFPQATDAEVHSALDKAQEAFTKDWRFRPIAERAQVIGRAADLVRERRSELAAIITLEMGKLIGEAEGEVALSADILSFYAKNGPDFLKDQPVPGAPGAFVSSEPLGVILAVEPWNFPIYQLARVAGPQLVAGNVIITKHARNVPALAAAFEQILTDAGAPKGVYTNLFCSFDHINWLIDDFRVRGVTLTGSEGAGTAVAERAGRQLKKVVLELGGSDPFIVLEDADMSLAVEKGAQARLENCGQVCVCAKRFIVVGRERGVQFLEGLTKVFKSLKIGDPADRQSTLGPLSSESAAIELEKQVKDAKAHGAQVLLGGNRINRPGFYFEPTIITNISPENPIYQQETFGPVAALYVVDTEEEAIELANVT